MHDWRWHRCLLANGGTGALFDHYVFQGSEVTAHIPEAKRGVLGELDADALAMLRARIKSAL